MIQAEPSARANPESLNNIKIRNGSEMAPITNFITLKKVYGPDNIKRFNILTVIRPTDIVLVKLLKLSRKSPPKHCR